MVLSRDLAEKEVKSWMDFKQVSARKREQKNIVEAVEKMINAFEDGILVLNPDNFDITQKLLFPMGVDTKTNQLVFKARTPYSKIQNELKGLAVDDIGKFVPAYIAASTGEPKAVIAAMDTEDFAIASAIATFFQ